MAETLRGPTNDLLAAMLGQHGTHTITDTAANTRAKGWVAIQIIEAAVFTTLTDEMQETGSDAPTTPMSYSANAIIYGLFTAVTLESGMVRCYSRP